MSTLVNTILQKITIFYTTQLLCQFCLKNGITIEKLVEKMGKKRSNNDYTLLRMFVFFDKLSQWFFNLVKKMKKNILIPVNNIYATYYYLSHSIILSLTCVFFYARVCYDYYFFMFIMLQIEKKCYCKR